MKKCSTCARTKPTSRFSRDNSRPCGLSPVCKDCHRAAVRARKARRAAGLPAQRPGRKPGAGWRTIYGAARVADLVDEDQVVRVSKIQSILDAHLDRVNELAAGMR